MLCLHGEKCYVGSTIKNGTFWYCAHLSSSCHFKCTEDDAELYAKAVKEFLATKQDRPKCCAIKSTLMTNGVSVEMPHLGRRYAKMKVVTDTKKESYGRPFFVCPIQSQNQRCNYFAWGDQTVFERPLCEHGKPSRLLTVKKRVLIKIESSSRVLNKKKTGAIFSNGSKKNPKTLSYPGPLSYLVILPLTNTP